MCGFVGLAWGVGREAPDLHPVARGVASIAHRGPDSGGTISVPFAHAEFRRLSVVDLEGGAQPMADERNEIQVFLNGEIYNHEELRRLLLRKGHVLSTKSDTEVLPHLWEEFGHAMLSMLNGMFAMCIVDSRTSDVYVVRDRLGVKPMFYAQTDHGVVFGSELKALLATGLVDREVEPW
ncbi:MAG: carbapenam-3-carboxylate synthase domain-containing protein, partial [Acidimicrobiales bacterium]